MQDSMDVEEESRPALSLNNSFDASLLKRSESDASSSAVLRYAASWDEQNKQQQQQQEEQQMIAPPLSAARKPASRSRLAAPSTTKRTPSSVKRPRMLQLPRSPHQHCALLEEPLPIKRAPKSSLGTHTTAASSTLLDETIDSASACDSAGTPFRFSAFPASLPRLSQQEADQTHTQSQQQPNQQQASRHGPTATVRKRMSFGGIAFLEQHQQQHQQQQQQHLDDFDYTINTSLSSAGYDSDHSNSQSNHLFGGAEEEDSNCSSLLGTPVLRTRLNFNALLSPNNNYSGNMNQQLKLLPTSATNTDFPTTEQLQSQAQPQQRYKDISAFALEDVITGDRFPSRAYEANRKSSMVSNVSSLPPTVHKNSDNNKNINNSRHTTTRGPSSPSRASMEPPVRLDTQHRPRTPREVQLHFQLDAQCSPIPGIPEEDGDMSSSPDAFRNNNTSRLSQDSSSSGKMSARPMPDMHAFDGEDLSSSHDRSFADDTVSSGTTGRQQPGPPRQPQSPKLLCPPTPVRTPAWAHSHIAVRPMFKAGHVKFARANSLVTTKVLATCPPQVLDGRASLENSSLEGDKSRDSVLSHELPPIKRANTEDSDDVETIDGEKEYHDNIMMECDGQQQHQYKPAPLWPPMAQAAYGDNHGAPNGPNEPAAFVAPLPTTLTTEASMTGADDNTPVVSMATHFEVLSMLGSGAFADVFRVRSKMDGGLYAVKRNRRPFRGRRDREKAMAEVKCMQKLQTSCVNIHNETNVNYSLYILFFFQAWQEDCHFFVQTELCCRDTLSDLVDSLRSQWPLAESRYPSLRQLPSIETESSQTDFGRLFPEETIWKICHDVGAGLSHIHSHGLVHFDIKPSNVFFVAHSRLGAMCKIGDFGMAGEIGSSEDGQEGDQKYMAPEILVSEKKHPSADIFSLGLTLYDLCAYPTFELPGEGLRWHDLRSGKCNADDIPKCRSEQLMNLVQSMLRPRKEDRPSADSILSMERVGSAGSSCESFLRSYILDIEEFDRREEERVGCTRQDDKTPRTTQKPRTRICSPTLNSYFQSKVMHSPEAATSGC